MRILIITPSYFPKITGNATCAKRIQVGLEKLSQDIMILTPCKVNIEKIKKFRPDVIHALHAYKSRIVMVLSKRLKIPYILTLTGTDYEGLINKNIRFDSQKRKATLKVIKRSSALVVYNEKTRKDILSKKKSFDKKLYVIGKNRPIIERSSNDFRSENGIGKKDFIFSLVSGIRPVKNNLFPVSALEPLQREHNDIILVLAGPIIDRKYHNLLKESIKGKRWIKLLGLVPFYKMSSLYEESDIILNCSHSEGESNAIIEAMFLGKPLLVSDIPGNISLVKDGVNGITYRKGDESDFFNKAEKMYNNKEQLSKLAKNTRSASKKITNLNEAKDYLSLYQRATIKYNTNSSNRALSKFS